MGPGLLLVAALLQAAGLQADATVRVEGRASRLQQQSLGEATNTGGRTDTVSTLVAPTLDLTLDAVPFLVKGTYAPQVRTNDYRGNGPAQQGSAGLETRTWVLPSHTATLRVESLAQSSWRGGASVTGVRARSDPFTDPLMAASMLVGTPQNGSSAGGNVDQVAPQQLPIIGPLEYEEFRSAADTSYTLADQRTTLGAAAGYRFSRSVDPAYRLYMPTLRSLVVSASVDYQATELDALTANVTTTHNWTALLTSQNEHPSLTSISTALAQWRRRLSPTLLTIAGAGASMTTRQWGVFQRKDPTYQGLGELGIMRQSPELELTLGADAQVTTTYDRYTGETLNMAVGTLTLGWRVQQETLISLSVLGASETKHRETQFVRGDAHVTRTYGRFWAFDVGIMGHSQKERRPGFPSFTQVVAFVGITYLHRGLARIGDEPPLAPVPQ